MTGCRYRSDVGFEGKCSDCAEWWPLTDEFWYPRMGMARCRSCINLSQRRGQRRLRAEDHAALRIADSRRYRREWEAERRRRVRLASGRGRYQRRRAA